MKHISILFALLFLASCTSNTIYKKPKDLIPKDTMVLLITDLYIASSAYYRKNKTLERKINYMPLVYDTYHIDSLRFIKSNLYYTSKIDTYEEMFNLIKTNLTLQKEALEKELNIPDENEKRPGKFDEKSIRAIEKQQ
ncbi:MAG: DUF4296 domain-containing protein [Polaribacter sp.]|nr:DUF4296 domain-containing protein [Polaribacter sp.]